MKKIVVDMETYYDKDFSLSKMQTDAYILDPRYQTIGVSVKVEDEPTQWFSGDEIRTGYFLSQFDWANSAVCCHNTMFDGFILTQRFGIKPKLWMDTLAMSRHLLPYLRSHSLASLAKHHGLTDKGTYVADAIGKRREDFSASELAAYGEYCRHDTNLTKALLDIFLPRMATLELKLIDMTVRMFTEPVLVGDVAMMQQLYEGEIARKANLLADGNVGKDVIMSNDKFAAALAARGVIPPVKISPKTQKQAWAFAKTDKGLTDLLEHDDPEVQALVAARLGVKTTIAETRAKTFWDMSLRGPLPVYLNYWGAKVSGRHAGGNKSGWQNLSARGPSAGIRYAIKAPPGHKIVVGDSSNIELRVNMAASGQTDILQQIINGEDLYCSFASKIFGRTITKADKAERDLGKLAELGLGYGAGWRKFQEAVRNKSGEILTDDAAQAIVNLYRRTHNKVVDLWERCGEILLPEIANGNPNLLTVDHNAWCLCTGEGFGIGGGPGVVYHNLRQKQNVDAYGRPVMDWVYTMGREESKIYSSKMAENLCQYVARMIVMWQTARYAQKYKVACTVHDEILSVVREEEVEEARKYMEECLSLAPPWCRGHIPLACETGVGDSYGVAK